MKTKILFIFKKKSRLFCKNAVSSHINTKFHNMENHLNSRENAKYQKPNEKILLELLEYYFFLLKLRLNNLLHVMSNMQIRLNCI